MDLSIMGLTTERKVFLGLMAIAGTSLIVDQAILSPSSASAGSLGVDQISILPDESIIADITEPVTKSVTQILNDRLGTAGTSGGAEINAAAFSNMFAPMIEAAAPQELSKPRAVPESVPVAVEPTQQIPVNMPSLSAVMPSRSGHSGAILNGTLHRVGEVTTDGYRLITVEQRKVLVEYKGQKYWLTLPAFED